MHANPGRYNRHYHMVSLMNAALPRIPGPSNSLMDPSIPMSMLHQPPVPSHLIDSPDEDVFGVPPPPDGFMGSMMRAQSLGNTDSENEALPLTIKTEIDDGRIRQGI